MIPRPGWVGRLDEPVDEAHRLGQQPLAHVVGREGVLDEAGVRAGEGDVEVGHQPGADRGTGVDDQPDAVLLRHPRDVPADADPADVRRIGLDEVERGPAQPVTELGDAGEALAARDGHARRRRSSA